MHTVTADPQRDASETIKEHAQDTTKETSAAEPVVEASNAPLLSWNAVVRVLADIEAKPAAAIAAVAVILVLSLFGRVGSLVVGALGGLLIHAAIERKREAVQYRTREREPAFAPEPDSAVLHARESSSPDTIPPKTNLALRYFWDLLIRDYVEWWFSPLCPDNEFPSACRRSLETIASSFAAHLQSKVPSEMVMLAIMSASSTLIVFFRELRAATVETESATGVDTYIRNNPDSALAQMVDERFQREKLRYLASRLLERFAKRTDFECEAGRLFARDMMTMQVFDMTATSCSTASYINWYIVETFKDSQGQGGLLGNVKDGRARDAEDAMARAVAEAAEMTRLLELEKSGANAITEELAPPVPVAQLPMEPELPAPIEAPTPRTTFASLLNDPEILPQQNRNSISLTPDRRATLGSLSVNSSTDALPMPASQPPESPQHISSPLHEDTQEATLQYSNITLMDLSTDAGTSKSIKQRSTLSYMITIEPPGGRVPGWMAIKQYTDFESLHDVLRRLANVGGIRIFPTELPEWRGRQHQALANDLEDYLKMAVSVKQLADSEVMKRFFGKEITEQSLGKKNKAWQPLKGVSAPLKGVGGGMRDAAEGSQKLLAAAWATTAGKKRASPVPEKSKLPEITVRDMRDEVPTPEEDTAYHSPLFRESMSRSGTLNSVGGEQEVERNSTSSSLNGYMFIGGDDESTKSASSTSLETPSVPSRPPEPEPEPSSQVPTPVSESISPPPPPISKSPSPAPQERPSKPVTKPAAPELSANDAQQILDIGFSILSELYALSPRTWMIRKSLLNLLKSLLISNGRTYIDTIRTMLQEDLINKCLASDDWLASQVKAVTESMFPSIPFAPIDDAAYKVQAKELFMSKMLPETMRGLMGGAATSQALEVVFEALQDQRVAKGILVALMCDIIRALQV